MKIIFTVRTGGSPVKPPEPQGFAYAVSARRKAIVTLPRVFLNDSRRKMPISSGTITVFSGIIASAKTGGEAKLVQRGTVRGWICYRRKGEGFCGEGEGEISLKIKEISTNQ